ncbi:MAG: three-Cys-motif partner protein TcmP [Phycisphaeraceae bacterium]
MPSKKPKSLWSAPPHTLAKLAILRSYLIAYFSILGSRTDSTREILYLDGFAGPNEYTDHPRGSPTEAVTAAAAAINKTANRWRAKGVKCIFIDRERWIVEHCRRKLGELPNYSRVEHEVRNGRFDEVLPSLIAEFPDHFRGDAPLFVFADPFGATGVPFTSIEKILSTNCSELFLNFDSDGLVRILKAQGKGNAEGNLTDIFGDESWRGELDPGEKPLLLAHRALALFKRRLRSITGVNYVFTFEMQKHQGSPDYHLVFASRHRLGLEKMKEAMRAISKEQAGFEFCDANVGMGSLFRFDRPEDWAAKVHDFFSGQTVVAESVWDFVLNETLLVNAKGVLEKLEKEAYIIIQRKPGARKKRDLELMESITFKAGHYAPPLVVPAAQKGLFDDGT